MRKSNIIQLDETLQNETRYRVVILSSLLMGYMPHKNVRSNMPPSELAFNCWRSILQTRIPQEKEL